jgi:pimeloyl-ACP methyl ester carboxylesterase
MITESRVCYNGVATRALSVPGDGSPIVLLHGFADSADTWRGVLTALEREGRQGIAVDLPGFGHAAARQPGPMVPQFDSFMDALIAGLGSVVLVGNSLGAATSVRAAARHPRTSVRAVVALNDPISARHRVARFARRTDHRRLLRLVAASPIPNAAVGWAVRRLAHRGLYGPGYVPAPDVIRHWVAAVPDIQVAAALARHAVQYAHETRHGHSAGAVECPALIVHGAKDRIIPVHSSRALHGAIPTSEMVVLPRSGHCPQLDDPAAVTRLVLDFLARSDADFERTG